MGSTSNTALLRRAFVDICRGYSMGRTKEGQTLYIRHLSHKEHLDYDLLQQHYEEVARKVGAQTEEERLAVLTAKGEWGPDKETAIERQRDFITRLEEGKKTIPIPSIMRSQEAQIVQERINLAKLIGDRARAIGMTSELYGAQKLEDYYLIHNLFVDSAFAQTFFSVDAFDDLDQEEVQAIHRVYQDAVEPCSDANLRRLAVQDFFVSYYSLCSDNLHAFYGKPICDLTYYQVRLGNMARYMKSLMDNTNMAQLTPEQRADPDAIEFKHTTQRNLDSIKAEGKAPIGMTAADLKETGMKQQFSAVPPTDMGGADLVNWLRSQQSRRG